MVIRFLLGFMESFKYRIVSSNRGDLNAFSFCTLLIHFYCLILGMTLSTMVNKNRAGKTAWNEFYFQNSFLVIFLVSQFPYWSLEFPLSVTDYYIWCGNLSWSWIHFLSHSSAFESSIRSLIHLKSRIISSTLVGSLWTWPGRLHCILHITSLCSVHLWRWVWLLVSYLLFCFVLFYVSPLWGLSLLVLMFSSTT